MSTSSLSPTAPAASCLVCGEPAGAAPTPCPICQAPHHFDCWEYNGGCATYGCKAKVTQRPLPTRPVMLPGKLGLPCKKAGTYEGRLWAPPVATGVLFVAQLLGMIAFALDQSGLAITYLAVYASCFGWILFSSLHFYIDFDRGKITRAKALFGWDVWESDVADLSEVSVLELRIKERGAKGPQLETLAVFQDANRSTLELAPAVDDGTPEHAEVVDLFRRIQVSGAFSCRLPASLVAGLPDTTHAHTGNAPKDRLQAPGTDS